MPEPNAETLNRTLKRAIDKHMITRKEGKTVAIADIAKYLDDLRPRQIYKWLNEEAFPANAANVITKLEGYIAGLDTTPGREITQQGGKPATATLPFQVTIPKGTLKLAQDKDGNIIVQGLLSMGLL